MPMRGGTHFLSLSLSLPVSQFLSLSLFLSFLIILNLLNNNNINNSRAEITLWGKSDSQREEASGVNTTTGDSFSETPSPPTEPLLPPSRFLFLKKKKATAKCAFIIWNFKYPSVCASVYVSEHPFLVNFAGVFEDSDKLYPRRPNAAGFLALCLTPHTCCCLWCAHPPCWESGGRLLKCKCKGRGRGQVRCAREGKS